MGQQMMKSSTSKLSAKVVASLLILVVYGCSKGKVAVSVSGNRTGSGSGSTDSGISGLPEIDSITYLAAKPGETIGVSGRNFTDGMVAIVGTTEVPMVVVSPEIATFVMPAGIAVGLVDVTFRLSDSDVKTLSLISDSGADDLPIVVADPSVICKDISFRNARGEVKSGTRACASVSLAVCTQDGQTNCRASSDVPAVLKAGLAAKVLSGQTLAGVNGAASAPTDCTSGNQVGCLATASYKAVDTGAITASAGAIRSSVTIAGVNGTLQNCTTNGGQGCYAIGTFRAGTLCAESGSNCFVGTYHASTQPLKAIDFTTIAPGVIKKDVVIAGVTGVYPNASYPLPVSGGVVDLDSSTFDAQITSATAFGWFDRTGVRHTGAGDSDIDAVKIKLNENIFNVVGSMTGATTPDPWNIRAGVTVNGVSGKIKTNCRNGGDVTNYDTGSFHSVVSINTTTSVFTVPNHGFSPNQLVQVSYTAQPGTLDFWTSYYVLVGDANTFQLSTSSGGSVEPVGSAGADVVIFAWNDGALGKEDTIDDYNEHGQPVEPFIAAHPWGSSNYFCSDVDDGNNAGLAGNVWFDVTTGGCSPSKCRMKDRISGLEWSKIFSGMDWGSAMAHCSTLTFDGVTGWRLPTQKELMSAYNHGLRSATNDDWIPTFDLRYYLLSSTTESDGLNSAFMGDLAFGNFVSDVKDSVSHSFSCVR